MAQHKWAKEIKAWADGAEIEARYFKADGWTEWKEETNGFIWYEGGAEYRIKPQPKEPQYLYVYKDTIDENGNSTTLVKISTVKLNIDRYIGKIKLETDNGA